jgi:hypothetical protein
MPRKVSKERRHELVQIYLHMGAAESREVCKMEGVSPLYAETQAHEMGIKPRYIPKGAA